MVDLSFCYPNKYFLTPWVDQIDQLERFKSSFKVFANASAMANPIIYAFTRDDLRKVAHTMFRRFLYKFYSSGISSRCGPKLNGSPAVTKSTRDSSYSSNSTKVVSTFSRYKEWVETLYGTICTDKWILIHFILLNQILTMSRRWIIACMIILNWIKIHHEAGPIFSQEK